MTKFSIIVPVYNVEKYIEKCLNSIYSQSYENFEVIIVNDGSPDNSVDIINKYVQKDSRFKLYNKKNGGLSDARNFGVKKAKGDYIIFVDSDDYINNKTLEMINNEINKYKNLDIIRYELSIVNEKHQIVKEFKHFPFSNKNINEAFPILLKNNYLDPAPLYAVNRKFMINNNFKFSENRFHEDFGLTLKMLISAKKISSIDFCGYYYVHRNNSIMNEKRYDHIRKKAFDTLYHFDVLYAFAKKCKNISNQTLYMFNNFIAVITISKIHNLNKNDKKKLIKELKKRKITKLILDDTFKRKIRKILYSISLNFNRWL